MRQLATWIALATSLAMTWSSQAMSDEPQISPGGSRIYRETAREHDANVPAIETPYLEEIQAHLDGVLGPNAGVWHEIVSDLVHIDLLVYPPNETRDHWTFVTAGMTAIPMTVPEELGEADQFLCELYISLPADWLVAGEDGLPQPAQLEDYDRFWPIALTKSLARLPFEYDTWLWHGHTIPNGDPATPYAEGKEMNGAVLLAEMGELRRAPLVETKDGKQIVLLAVVPLHADEMDYKLEKGVDSLLEKLDAAGVTDVLDPNRASVLQKRGLFDFLRKS